MSPYNNYGICCLVLFYVLFLTTSVLSLNEDERNLLQGLNGYRSSTVNLPLLREMKEARCLATELVEVEFKNRACVTTTAGNAIPANSGSQFQSYGKLLHKCRIDPNKTADGIILPVCVYNLVPTWVLTNYTRSPYNRYVNDSRFTGAGIGADVDWIVLILTTSTVAGSLASHGLSVVCCNLIQWFLTLLLVFFLVW